MYNLYRKERTIRIFMYIFSVMLLLFGVASLISAFRSDPINVVEIFGGIFFFGLAFIFFKIGGANANPYSEIDKLRAQSPEKVKDIEREFETAENLYDKIWLGPTYIFLHCVQFEAVHYNDIKSIRLYKRHSGRYSFYLIEVLINERKTEVYFTKYGDGKAIATNAARRLAALTGAPLINELLY